MELLKPYRNYPVKRVLNTVVDSADISVAMVQSMIQKQSDKVKITYRDGKRIVFIQMKKEWNIVFIQYVLT